MRYAQRIRKVNCLPLSHQSQFRLELQDQDNLDCLIMIIKLKYPMTVCALAVCQPDGDWPLEIGRSLALASGTRSVTPAPPIVILQPLHPTLWDFAEE